MPLKPYSVKLRTAHIYSIRDIYVVLYWNFSTAGLVPLKLILQQKKIIVCWMILNTTPLLKDLGTVVGRS